MGTETSDAHTSQKAKGKGRSREWKEGAERKDHLVTSFFILHSFPEYGDIKSYSHRKKMYNKKFVRLEKQMERERRDKERAGEGENPWKEFKN